MIQQSSVSTIAGTRTDILRGDVNIQRRQAFLIIMALIAVALIFSFYIYQSAKITITYSRMDDLRDNYTRLIYENSNTLGHLAIANGIRHTAQAAFDMGFRPIEPLNYLHVSVPEPELSPPEPSPPQNTQ